jgi:hypothetical protein
METWSSTSLRNVGILQPDYTASYRRLIPIYTFISTSRSSARVCILRRGILSRVKAAEMSVNSNQTIRRHIPDKFHLYLYQHAQGCCRGLHTGKNSFAELRQPKWPLVSPIHDGKYEQSPRGAVLGIQQLCFGRYKYPARAAKHLTAKCCGSVYQLTARACLSQHRGCG